MREKRGISPVIATVIIVAIAITVTIVVGLWITGSVGTFTRFERLEIISAYAEKTDTKFTIHLIANNTGSAALTITEIFINGKPISKVVNATDDATIRGQTIDPGKNIKGYIKLPISFTSEQTVEIVLHTASGKDYSKNIILKGSNIEDINERLIKVENDIIWLKRLYESLDVRTWQILTGVIISVIMGFISILLRLYKK